MHRMAMSVHAMTPESESRLITSLQSVLDPVTVPRFANPQSTSLQRAFPSELGDAFEEDIQKNSG